ncbi:hypothetical protein B0H34DRAFT_675988 [Crassisporium funariophilum]|nr:hypothetical protein B0H34DRAFT_675988 [Crassisporium funariophilum]
MFSFSRISLRSSPRTSEESEEALLPSDKDSHHSPTCRACGRSSSDEEDKGSPSFIYSWAVIICLVCTIVNCILTFSDDFPAIINPIFSVDRNQYNNLRRPSPFIGLEKIKRPAHPTPRTLINYPQIIAQVDSANKHKVFDDDPKRFMSHTGFVSPEDRRVKITKTVSTITQFRAIDFGMESCEVKLRFPANLTTRLAESAQKPFFISVYRLAEDKPLNTKSLSQSNAPNRLALVDNIQVIPGVAVDWHNTFNCPWDTVLSFELACFGTDRPGFESTEECSLEWWQNKDEDDPDMAVYMLQHATV